MTCDSPDAKTPKTITIISHSNGLFTVGSECVSNVVKTIDDAEARAQQLEDEAGGPTNARIVRIECTTIDQGGSRKAMSSLTTANKN